MAYPRELRDSIVSRVLAKEISIAAASQMYGMGEETIRTWKKQALSCTIPNGTVHSESLSSAMTKLKLPKGVTYLQAIKAVSAKEVLNETDFGKYCRERGLLESEVREWGKWLAKHPNVVDGKELEASNLKLLHSQRLVAQKDRELARKDKALANTATMLMLSKKAEAIWGNTENTSAPKIARS